MITHSFCGLLLMMSVSLRRCIGAFLGLWAHAKGQRTPSTCADYADYAIIPHEPYSDGPLKLPDMRPSPDCRTFNSSAVEKVISDMQARLKDPDLAMMFANTFPSTLDTTVKYFDPELNLAFIITGFAHLYKLLPQDADLQALIKAVINTESRYISAYPYCGKALILPASAGEWTLTECEREYLSWSGRSSHIVSMYLSSDDQGYATDVTINPYVDWPGKSAIGQIMAVIRNQSESSWSDDWEFVSYYNWTGTAGSLSPPVTNSGNGEPKVANGLVASSHRPSDDLCVFNFITSDNAMMSVELAYLADTLDEIGTLVDVSHEAREHSGVIRDAVWNHTLTTGGIFAYETNGYGGQYIMDDANVPSLVSLPYLGFLDRSDATYVKTKDVLFSRLNPYYAVGKNFNGIGGPHVNATYPWPMSHISAIYGTDDDEEITGRLSLIMNNTGGLGLVHESINIYNSSDYTRPWFAWANSYFAEMVLDLAQRKPGLVLKDATPYVVGT
ncbi:Six-hairpin glycosidase-like protein [Xylariales sp. AK1849]|nr:Six-hairpin glycosidase-like protein [Xylariales sp. AK1849]